MCVCVLANLALTMGPNFSPSLMRSAAVQSMGMLRTYRLVSAVVMMRGREGGEAGGQERIGWLVGGG